MKEGAVFWTDWDNRKKIIGNMGQFGYCGMEGRQGTEEGTWGLRSKSPGSPQYSETVPGLD